MLVPVLDRICERETSFPIFPFFAGAISFSSDVLPFLIVCDVLVIFLSLFITPLLFGFSVLDPGESRPSRRLCLHLFSSLPTQSLSPLFFHLTSYSPAPVLKFFLSVILWTYIPRPFLSPPVFNSPHTSVFPLCAIAPLTSTSTGLTIHLLPHHSVSKSFFPWLVRFPLSILHSEPLLYKSTQPCFRPPLFPPGWPLTLVASSFPLFCCTSCFDTPLCSPFHFIFSLLFLCLFLLPPLLPPFFYSASFIQLPFNPFSINIASLVPLKCSCFTLNCFFLSFCWCISFRHPNALLILASLAFHPAFLYFLSFPPTFSFFFFVVPLLYCTCCQGFGL